MILIQWICSNLLMAGMELPNRSLWWVPTILLMAAAIIGWPFVGAYYSLSEWMDYTKYLCGMYAVLMIALVRVWLGWVRKGNYVSN